MGGMGRLTEPKETKGNYQDQLFLILCENCAIPTMVGDDAGGGGEQEGGKVGGK
jgi:hypothetical protein